MSRLKILLSVTLFLVVLAVSIGTVGADPILVYADPMTIPPNTTTTIHIGGPNYPIEVNSITVTGPDGVVYTYIGSLPITITSGDFTVTFGTNAPDKAKWAPESNTQASGDYVISAEGVEGGFSGFSVITDFMVPESILATTAIIAIGFAGLTLIRRKTTRR